MQCQIMIFSWMQIRMRMRLGCWHKPPKLLHLRYFCYKYCMLLLLREVHIHWLQPVCGDMCVNCTFYLLPSPFLLISSPFHHSLLYPSLRLIPRLSFSPNFTILSLPSFSFPFFPLPTPILSSQVLSPFPFFHLILSSPLSSFLWL